MQAKVIAVNERGESLPSPANTAGAQIEVEPAKITDLVEDSQTSHQQVVIDWSAPDDGGSPILSYVIYWDNGDTNAAVGDFTELVGQPS